MTQQEQLKTEVLNTLRALKDARFDVEILSLRDSDTELWEAAQLITKVMQTLGTSYADVLNSKTESENKPILRYNFLD